MGSHVIVVLCSRRPIARVKAIERNPTFGTESLRNPDVLLIFIRPNLTVDTLSNIWQR